METEEKEEELREEKKHTEDEDMLYLNKGLAAYRPAVIKELPAHVHS